MSGLKRHRVFRQSNKNWYLYICKAITGRYYTGISKNPKQRLLKHNRGYGAKFAINQGPFTLVYISPAISTKSQARRLEIKIKNWSQDKKHKLINNIWKLPII